MWPMRNIQDVASVQFEEFAVNEALSHFGEMEQ